MQIPEARELFIEKFTVNVTEMFREPYCFNIVRQKVLPRLKQKEQINIWCAGCSTGEEVLSLCILLEEQGLLDRAVITATDLSRSALKKAQKASYPTSYLNGFHQAYHRSGGKNTLSDYYILNGDWASFDPQLTRQVYYSGK
ncbi:MAG: CheR family methyltransferase [Owenweeksia sp.]|nr:CheR family methyltransferase [Owenweeksia sp.]